MADVAAVRPAEGAIRSWVALYRSVIRNSMMNSLQYRANTLVDTVLMAAEPVVYLMVWQIVAREQGGEVDGFTPGRFAAYYVTWALVRTFTQTGNPKNWERAIQEGRMSGLLMRPIHPVHQDLGLWLGFGAVRAAMWIPVGAVLFVAFRPDYDTNLLQMAVFAVAIAMAMIIRTLLNALVGFAAFWVIKIGAITSVLSTVELLTSGRLVPLELMPAWAQDISWALPFRWAFSFPIEVLIGPVSTIEMLTGLAMQAGWLAGICVLLRLVWSRGVRRYSAVGG